MVTIAGRSRSRGGSRIAGTSYLVPFVLLFVLLGLFPLVYSGFVSLHQVNLESPNNMTFVGLGNYRALLSDSYFWNALRNTITLGVLACGPQLIIAILVANLLNYTLRFRTFWRVAIFLPYAASVAASALIFAQLYAHNHGFINWLLSQVGIGPVNWQTGTFASQLAIASIVTWRWTGYNALIYLASMQSIPGELYEAAEVDGASRWRQFLKITVPGIRPTILFTAVVSTIGAMQLFTEPLLYEGGSTGVQGGLSHQYQTLALYMYQQGFTFFHLGYASSVAFSVLILILAALGFGFALMRTWTKAGDALRARAEGGRA